MTGREYEKIKHEAFSFMVNTLGISLWEVKEKSGRDIRFKNGMVALSRLMIDSEKYRKIINEKRKEKVKT